MKNTRIARFGQVILFLVALCMLAFGSTEARADSPGTGAISIVPGNGAPKGIQLRSQTVGIAISEDATGAWADTDLWVQLHNRSNSPVVIPIGIPGSQIDASELPEIIDATVDGRALTLIRVLDPEKPEIRATAIITVPVRGNTAIRVRYRQALPTQAGLVSYAYPLMAGRVWAGVPESLRVSITFTRPLPPEQILHLTPAPHSRQPDAVTWEWSGVKAPSNLGLSFMSSQWWSELESERTAATAPGAGLREHVALGERYWHLATLASPALEPRASFYNQYLPLALAEFRVAVAAAAPGTSSTELAAIRQRLAGLYLAQGGREGGPAGETYLQLAVDELAAAMALNPSDAELRSSATALLERLAGVAQARGDRVGEELYIARLQAIANGHASPAPDERIRNEALALAQDAVAAGDFAGARQLLNNTFGAEALILDDVAPSRITQSLLVVNNVPGERAIVLQLLDTDRGAADVISAAATSLRGLAQVASSGSALTVTLAYSESASLLEQQDRLHAALPDLPELALLSSALSTRHLAWPVRNDVLMLVNGYEESVDLSTCSATWQTQAEKLERAALAAEQAGQPLDKLRAAIWRADARAWQAVADHSRATYHTEIRERGAGPDWLRTQVYRVYQEGFLQREWAVKGGERRQLEASVLSWRYDRLALASAAVLLFGVLLSFGAWSISRARAEPGPARATDSVDP